ncbi:hypothetical protein SE17_18730 [Kouleothrix aurantiaca]|uniref:Uncharacterized protein n=1 Tax=Kouleothrix aurantiaca TaxID=186479 RepID=A0A0P9DFD9_9CHLR|nr:hypothetical protein SE17_18730 [Kouleothrix aurantiaca]
MGGGAVNTLYDGEDFMDDDTKRRLVYGILSLVLSALATRLALFLTNKLLGEPDEGTLVG